MDLLELLSLLGFAHHLIGNDRKVKYNHISNRVTKFQYLIGIITHLTEVEEVYFPLLRVAESGR